MFIIVNMDIAIVISLADADIGLAMNLEAGRTGTETVTRLATGQHFAKVDIAIELESRRGIARPDDGRWDFLGVELDFDPVADRNLTSNLAHHAARRDIAGTHQLVALVAAELDDA